MIGRAHSLEIMERPAPLNVWLAGDFGHVDFGPAMAWLRDVASCEFIAGTSPLPQIAATPAAVVVFQARPGSITQRDVERLHRHAPLARFIVVAGPWCEGELRSGQPARGVIRMLWHEWKQRLPTELGLLPNRQFVAAPSMRTLTLVDRLLQSVARPVVERMRHGRAAVLTTRYGRFAALADLCLAAGLDASLTFPGSLPAGEVAVCVADGWESLRKDEQCTATSPPIMLLLDWPRPSDLDQAEQLGIAGVLGQPLLVTDFLAALDRVLPPRVEVAVADPAA